MEVSERASEAGNARGGDRPTEGLAGRGFDRGEAFDLGARWGGGGICLDEVSRGTRYQSVILGRRRRS